MVRPGGHVAVFENDEFHHVLLPWPVEIELAIKQAELLAFVEKSDRPRKYYVGRDLRRVFRLAGMAPCTVRSVAFTRQAPLDPATRSFLEGYLKDLRRLAGPHLEPSLRDLFDRLTNPASRHSVLSGPDFCFTCVNHVVVGVRCISRPGFGCASRHVSRALTFTSRECKRRRIRRPHSPVVGKVSRPCHHADRRSPIEAPKGPAVPCRSSS